MRQRSGFQLSPEVLFFVFLFVFLGFHEYPKPIRVLVFSDYLKIGQRNNGALSDMFKKTKYIKNQLFVHILETLDVKIQVYYNRITGANGIY